MSVADKDMHNGHRERLRKRLLETEKNQIIPHELLEAMLFYAIRRGDTNPLAHRLMNTFGSLENILSAQESDLVQVRGVGKKTAEYLRMLGILVEKCQTICRGRVVYAPGTAGTNEYIRGLFPDINREQVYMLFMDGRSNVVRQMLMFEGTFENVSIDLSEMLRTALICRASSVVCVHNHPSGIARPSQADSIATRKMTDSFRMIDIKLSDHLIVTDNEIYGIISNSRYSLMR